jgi:hypothetical protein
MYIQGSDEFIPQPETTMAHPSKPRRTGNVSMHRKNVKPRQFQRSDDIESLLELLLGVKKAAAYVRATTTEYEREIRLLLKETLRYGREIEKVAKDALALAQTVLDAQVAEERELQDAALELRDVVARVGAHLDREVVKDLKWHETCTTLMNLLTQTRKKYQLDPRLRRVQIGVKSAAKRRAGAAERAAAIRAAAIQLNNQGRAWRNIATILSGRSGVTAAQIRRIIRSLKRGAK